MSPQRLGATCPNLQLPSSKSVPAAAQRQEAGKEEQGKRDYFGLFSKQDKCLVLICRVPVYLNYTPPTGAYYSYPGQPTCVSRANIEGYPNVLQKYKAEKAGHEPVDSCFFSPLPLPHVVFRSSCQAYALAF